MGKTAEIIPVFTDDIAIWPDEATRFRDIARRVELREFAAGQRLYLNRIRETGELIATRQDGVFIRGQECA